MQKFKRNYQAVFYITDLKSNNTEVVIIEPPFAVNFNIEHGVGGFNGVFQFYNLSYDVQRKLWMDWQTKSDKKIKMMFYAGYGDTENLTLIMNASLFYCTSQRPNGSVDFITEIQTMADAETFSANGFANSTFEAGSEYSSIIQSLISEISGLKLGYVSENLKSLPNSRTFFGNALEQIKQEFWDYNVFIDNGELNVLSDEEYIPTDVPVISEKTGMLGTPKVAMQFLEVDTMFEPNLKLYQLVYVDTVYRLIQKQLYKIYNIRHSGTISMTSSDKLVTSLRMQFLIKENKKATKPNEAKETKRAEQVSKTSYGWIKPVNGVITSRFHEYRKPPRYSKIYYHDALDIAAVSGTPVKAPANGIVSSAGVVRGYGNYLQLKHNNGLSSAYGHLDRFAVQVGANVNKGDVIGYVGTTTGTNKPVGAHLHWEVFKDGVKVNPNDFVRYY